MSEVACAVSGCTRKAEYEVILYDFYPTDGTVFFERDHTCPLICRTHAIENEVGAKGVRQPRGHVEYPHSNRNLAQGFTIYRPVPEVRAEAHSSEHQDYMVGGNPTVH